MEDFVKEQLEQTLPVAWQHKKELGDCMIDLYKNTLWTDVKLRCKDHDDNERIRAHKIVLAARSPVFQAMFFGPCANGQEEVQLDNFDAKILDLFLRYLYSDTVTLAEDNASLVLEMAHYYQVSNLVQFCADYLASITTVENACEFLNLALRYEVTTLRDACCTIIDESAEEILSSEKFLELSEDCLTYILKGDTFYADEYGIFMKAEEWSKRKLEERNIEKTGPNVRKTLGRSFYYIRLPTLTYKTLMECTRKKGYFSVDEYEDISDFINNIPDSLVESNSCIARFPTEEILTVNNECGETNTTDTLTTTFQISVSRDIELKNVNLVHIKKYFKYDDRCYSDRYSRCTRIDEHNTYAFLEKYNGKTVKINGSFAYVLEELTETDLSEDLSIVISGRLEVKGHTTKLSDNTDKLQEEIEEAGTDDNLTDEKTNDDENGPNLEESLINHSDDEDLILEHNFQLMSTEVASADDNLTYEGTDDNENGPNLEESWSNHGDEEDDGECLIFEQNFQLMSTEETQRVVVLTEPLTLTKSGSPYTVTVNLGYSCESEIKMKTDSSSDDIVTSEYGDVKVENISGDFAGVKSLGFENISNREIAK